MIKDDGWKIIYVRVGFLVVLIQGDLLKHSKPSGFFYSPQGVDINKFYVLPTQCIYVFCVDLRTNSVYFLMQHSEEDSFRQQLDLNLKKSLLKCYIWSIALRGAGNWTLQTVDQKYLESFEMWCWRKMRNGEK